VAHLYLKISLIIGLLLGLTAQSANCQAYNYRSGNARVIQGAGGLPNPSSSYITGGTLSHSAQVGAGISAYGYLPSGSSTGAVAGAGITPGISGNSNLPAARMGSTVGMPGDYMRSDLNPNFTYQQQPRQNVQYRNNQQRYNQRPQGSNQPATYGQPYARTGSMPTGRQATQIPTITPTHQTQAAPAATAGSTPAAGTGAPVQSEYKGY
jgi:hypothetical protein